MKTIHLGNTNLQVSPFCLGAMMFGGKTDRGEAIEIVHQAVDAGAMTARLQLFSKQQISMRRGLQRAL